MDSGGINIEVTGNNHEHCAINSFKYSLITWMKNNVKAKNLKGLKITSQVHVYYVNIFQAMYFSSDL